eukprot:gene10956-3028_t
MDMASGGTALVDRNKASPDTFDSSHHQIQYKSFLGTQTQKNHSQKRALTEPQLPPTSNPHVSRARRFAPSSSGHHSGSFFASYQEERLSNRDARSLEHWNNTLKKWESQELRISQRTGLPIEQLNMQSHELYTKKLQLRHAVEEAMPAVESGKGFRVGSEFWSIHQPTKSNLFYTLTKTEKGERAPVEFSSRPERIQNEMHAGLAQYRTRENQDDAYIMQRLHNLEPYLDGLVKHVPDLEHLEVVGERIPICKLDKVPVDSFDDMQDNMKPLDNSDEHNIGEVPDDTSQADIENTSILDKKTSGFGDTQYENKSTLDTKHHIKATKPCVVFEVMEGGLPCTHSGPLSSVTPYDPHEGCFVLFHTVPGQRSQKSVRLRNIGPTVVYFKWEKLPCDNTIGRQRDTQKHFFVDLEPNAILPGDYRDIHVRFLSQTSGVFTENWHFVMTPTALDSTPLLAMCGVTECVDDFVHSAQPMMERMEKHQIEKMIRKMLDHVITNIAPRPRPATPEGRWRTDAPKFIELNQNTLESYREDVVHRLAAFYDKLTTPTVPAEESISVSKGAVGSKKGRHKSEILSSSMAAQTPSLPSWSYCVEDIREICLDQPDIQAQEDALREFYSICSDFLPGNPVLQSTLKPSRLDVGDKIFRRQCIIWLGHDITQADGTLRKEFALEPAVTPEIAEPEPLRRKDARSGKSRGQKSRSESAKSNTQVATVASNVLEIKKIEEDPAKLAEFQEKLYIEVRLKLMQRIDQMLAVIDDLPMCSPFDSEDDD